MSTRTIERVCITCDITFKAYSSSLGKYCSIRCQKEKEYRDYINRWQIGLETGWIGKTKQLSNHIRRFIFEEYGSACQVWGWDKNIQ